jgi:general stress protein 26
MSFTWSPSVAMGREEIDRFLQQTLVARLTSIRLDGYPHTTPLWYVWDGEALWFEIGAGARPRQHLRNLRQNSKLCVMIDRDARPERGGVFDAQGMLMRGTVELSTDETLQEEVSRQVLTWYIGDEGE